MEKKLTKSETRAYVEFGGHRCPYCNSKDIEGSKPYFVTNRILLEIECNMCERMWEDIYTLSDIRERD